MRGLAFACLAGPGAAQDFTEVGALFADRCVMCHSDNSKLDAPPEGLRPDKLESVLNGGDRLVVLPGRPEMSELWRRVTGLADPRMPFDASPWLPEDDIRLIRDWISQGAPDAEGVPAHIPEGLRIGRRGVLTGEAEIDGAALVIDGGTRVDERLRIGDNAEMRGVLQADGTVRAERFRDR